MNIPGCFVVWGKEIAPHTVLLTLDQYRHYHRNTLTERGRGIFYAHFFGRGVQYVIPAWNKNAMVGLAQNYSGVHEVAVKGLCAAIALGIPYGYNDSQDKPPNDGGSEVKPIKPPRKPKGSGGASFADLLKTQA